MANLGPEKMITDPQQLAELQAIHNPNNEPVGHFTGRCANCHSKALWDDATAYGCKCCGALFMTGHLLPKVVDNETGQEYTWEEFYGEDDG
jgi:hypothetical protein